MRIAHIVWGMQTGGVETMLVNIINEQVKTEEVELIIINNLIYKPLLEKISPACKILFCKRQPASKNPWPIIKLNYWLWRYSPDIIHIHSTKISDTILNKRKIVRTIHCTHNNCREYPKMKALFSISKVVKLATLKQGFDSIIVENGICCNNIKRKENYSIQDNCYQLVQVSRLSISEKGQDLIIKAINELINKRCINNLHMHFIGEGRSRTVLEQMVKNYKLEKYITFQGVKTQDYLFSHLCEYDCFIQPSRYEGFGLTVAEAIVAGLPVLVSNIEGPMEIIDNGRLGMCFKSEDYFDLADKLEIILRGEYDYSLIKMARQRVCQKYNVKETAKKYIKEYKKII